MSSAIASARQRRAGLSPEPPSTSPSLNKTDKPTSGLTLQQIINLIDIRLIKIEKYVSDNMNASKDSTSSQEKTSPVISDEILDEYEQRFELLANEIATLKDIVLKLQSYTMDVNRVLLEERESTHEKEVLGETFLSENNDNEPTNLES
jgi:hypothetical protein